MRLIELRKYISFISVAVATVLCVSACDAWNSSRKEDEEEEKTVVPYTERIRIAWDYRTLTQVYDKQVSYPRIIRLNNDDLLTAFEHQGEVYVSHSSDDGAHWSEAELVAPRDGKVISAVPELIQLKNGNILLAYNTRF